MFGKSTRIRRYGDADVVTYLSFALVACSCLFCCTQSARAAITWTGNLDPADPTTWDSDNTHGYVGYTADGSLTVDGGSDFISSRVGIGRDIGITGQVTVSGIGSTWTNSDFIAVGSVYGGNGRLMITDGGSVTNGSGYISYGSDSTGEVTVTGTGSTWTNRDNLYVGYYGNGSLTISDGGTVTVANETRVASEVSSTGTIAFGPGGGTLTTRTLFFSSQTQLTGTGTINTHGLVSDFDLIFDTVESLTQTLHLDNEPGQDVTVNIDLSNPYYLGAGWAGNGSLVIRDGITVRSQSGWLGYKAGSTGSVTVSGTNSIWTTSDHFEFHVGYYGNGSLTISDGGTVFNHHIRIGEMSGSTGEATVTGAGSTWISNSDLYVGWSGSGSLTISDGGSVISGLDGILGREADSAGEVMVTGTGTTWTISSDLLVGQGGSGAVTISNGGLVINDDGSIGDGSESTSAVTVAGTGSRWINSGYLDVGSAGSGSLAISNGGYVISDVGTIGYGSDSTGTVKVSGAGSTWINRDKLYVGDDGSGSLTIANGGKVSAASASINDQSCLAVDVNNSSQLTVSSGTITNDGTVRLIAGAGPEKDAVYTPIFAGTWTGSGSYQALGGTWNGTTQEFTSSGVEAGISGTAVSIDLADKQRVLIEDSTSGWTIGASFLAKTVPTSLDFTATAISGEVLSALEDQLQPEYSVVGGWQFVASGGYTPGDPAYLSFDVGSIQTQDDLKVWHYDGADWTEYDAWDLTNDGTYAGFTVTDFSGYAVTSILLIPGDSNCDGSVDVSDLGILATNYGVGSGCEWGDGDFSGDGAVDVSDLGVLATNYGYGTAITNSAPEPTSITLLLCGLTGFLCLRRR